MPPEVTVATTVCPSHVNFTRRPAPTLPPFQATAPKHAASSRCATAVRVPTGSGAASAATPKSTNTVWAVRSENVSASVAPGSTASVRDVKTPESVPVPATRVRSGTVPGRQRTVPSATTSPPAFTSFGVVAPVSEKAKT